ncbi:MAG: hypothetical protein JXR76_22960 [Deltaproteobacteria bacterium]|nr:hypothetical protein [Deltaproteobacteria bacterium]
MFSLKNSQRICTVLGILIIGMAPGCGNDKSSTSPDTIIDTGGGSDGSTGTDSQPSLEQVLPEMMGKIPELFHLNQQRQREGYYMAEFEFKMLGLAYWLDQGQYEQAVTGLQTLAQQLETTDGLIKVPAFTSVREEYEFYRSMQNPTTGAFMDDSFPVCTYAGPTHNVILHLEELAAQLGEPLQLKYPLTFLNEFNTPATLVPLLDSLASVGPIVANMPQTPFELAREILGLYQKSKDDSQPLFAFTAEFEKAILTWFYNHQDSTTGLWGPTSRETGELISLDVDNTASIVKTFVDREGNTIHPSFPLRYKTELIATTLAVLNHPLPDDDALDEWHEWGLKTGKGMYLLLRYLWKDMSAETTQAARLAFERIVRIRFEKFYVKEEGAFSYYPATGAATLEGTNAGFNALKEVGAVSTALQNELWHNPLKSALALPPQSISDFSGADMSSLAACNGVASIRFYQGETVVDVLTGIIAVYYPGQPVTLDMVHLMQGIKAWLDTMDQSMGNWVSKEALLGAVAAFPEISAPVNTDLPISLLNATLNEAGFVTAIGFDTLQIPMCKLVFFGPSK